MKKLLFLAVIAGLSATAVQAQVLERGDQYQQGMGYHKGYVNPAYSNQGNQYPYGIAPQYRYDNVYPGYEQKGYSYTQGHYGRDNFQSAPQGYVRGAPGGVSNGQPYEYGRGSGPIFYQYQDYITDDDRRIFNDLKNALQNDQGRFENVQFSVDNGRVTLRGSVKTEEDRRDMQYKVRNIKGVVNIIDQVFVGGNPPSQKRTPDGQPAEFNQKSNRYSNSAKDDLSKQPQSANDYNIQKQVQASLDNNKNVNVAVRNGVVTLTGQVNSQQEKDSVEQVVKSVKGVQSVKNQLSVQGQ